MHRLENSSSFFMDWLETQGVFLLPMILSIILICLYIIICIRFYFVQYFVIAGLKYKKDVHHFYSFLNQGINKLIHEH